MKLFRPQLLALFYFIVFLCLLFDQSNVHLRVLSVQCSGDTREGEGYLACYGESLLLLSENKTIQVGHSMQNIAPLQTIIFYIHF